MLPISYVPTTLRYSGSRENSITTRFTGGTGFEDAGVVLRVRRAKGLQLNPCYECAYDGNGKLSCKSSHAVHGECKGKIFTPCTLVGTLLYRLFGL